MPCQPCSAIQVDVGGFEEEMQVQRQRSKDSARTVDLSSGGLLGELASQLGATQFMGYTQTQGQGRVVALVRDGKRVQSASAGGWSAGAMSCVARRHGMEHGSIKFCMRAVYSEVQLTWLHMRMHQSHCTPETCLLVALRRIIQSFCLI